MIKAIRIEVKKRITKFKTGQVIFLSDFRGLGTDAGVRKVVSRLCEEGRIKRIAQGIYLVPEIDSVLGELTPSIEKLLKE